MKAIPSSHLSTDSRRSTDAVAAAAVWKIASQKQKLEGKKLRPLIHKIVLQWNLDIMVIIDLFHVTSQAFHMHTNWQFWCTAAMY